MKRAGEAARAWVLACWFVVSCGGEEQTAPAQLELGVGERAFEVLPRGGHATLYAGNQGGHHVWVSFRTRGLAPAGVRMVLDLTPPPPLAPSHWDLPIDLEPVADEDAQPFTHEFVGWRGQLLDPACTVGMPVEMALTLVDRDGVQVSASNLVIPDAPPEGFVRGCAPETAPFDAQLPVRKWLAHGDYSTLSSPRARDLNGDGVLDLVLGHGVELSAHDGEAAVDPSQIRTLGSVTAHDGATGSLLWQFTAAQDVVGSAAFVDVDGDGVDDAIIGGRYAELVALNGRDGTLLWRYFEGEVAEARAAGIYNFYSALVVADRNGDQVDDLVVANGGDATLGPDEPRPVGHLLGVSGKDGALLGSIEMPDGAETYQSPTHLVVDDEESIVFGSGGESFGGSLWRMPVADLFASEASRIRKLASDADTGFVAPASLADLSGDGVRDIVAASYGGHLFALDGESDELLFELTVPGAESHSAALLAQVTDDGVPDVLWTVNTGAWPNYTGAHQLLLDGASGRTLWEGELGLLVPSGHVAADLNGDGRDEVFVGTNELVDPDAGELAFALYALDPLAMSVTQMGEYFRRPAIATPWLGDLDGDGDVELVVASSYLTSKTSTWWLERFDLHAELPATPFMGAYMGSRSDGNL